MPRRTSLIVALTIALLAVILSQAAPASAAEKLFVLSGNTPTNFYDAEGNTLGLQLDVSAAQTAIIVTINGAFVGYAQPIYSSQGPTHSWDARGATVREFSDTFTVRSSELGPWYWEKIGPVNPNLPEPHSQTPRY